MLKLFKFYILDLSLPKKGFKNKTLDSKSNIKIGIKKVILYLEYFIEN
jgi:hypothetical protein